MEKAKPSTRCPNCGTRDAPKLVVEGSGNGHAPAPLPNVYLRCRRCEHEWSELPPERRAS